MPSVLSQDPEVACIMFAYIVLARISPIGSNCNMDWEIYLRAGYLFS